MCEIHSLVTPQDIQNVPWAADIIVGCNFLGIFDRRFSYRRGPCSQWLGWYGFFCFRKGSSVNGTSHHIQSVTGYATLNNLWFCHWKVDDLITF